MASAPAAVAPGAPETAAQPEAQPAAQPEARPEARPEAQPNVQSEASIKSAIVELIAEMASVSLYKFRRSVARRLGLGKKDLDGRAAEVNEWIKDAVNSAASGPARRRTRYYSRTVTHANMPAHVDCLPSRSVSVCACASSCVRVKRGVRASVSDCACVCLQLAWLCPFRL